jgi:hypothetical protein
MISSKPADVTFNSALFVGADDAGLAVEGIDVECERNATQRSASTRWRENPITWATAALGFCSGSARLVRRRGLRKSGHGPRERFLPGNGATTSGSCQSITTEVSSRPVVIYRPWSICRSRRKRR